MKFGFVGALIPPVLENNEGRSRTASVLSVVMLTILAIAIVRTLLAFFGPPEFLSVLLRQNALLCGVFLALFIVMRFGHVRVAAFLFTLYQWLAVVWLTYRYGGVSLSVYSFFIFVILASGLLLGGNWAVGYAAASLVYGTLLLYMERIGLLTPGHLDSVESYFAITPSFITTAVLVYLYHRDITGALTKVQDKAAELGMANARLSGAIEERKAIEEQLIQSQKMEAIGTLAGGIAHDFNNILSAIYGYTELAKRNLANPKQLMGDLDEVMKGAERAKSLVGQILTFSRRTRQEQHPLQVSLVVKEVLNLLRASIPATIDVQAKIVSKAFAIANPVQIHQIVMNLCTNAYQSMQETGGTLSVLLKDVEPGHPDVPSDLRSAADGYILLEVRDTGIGMDEVTRSKIFEPYFTTKEIGEGTGLGLAVVHGIVEGLGGDIVVHSRPGKGSTFSIYIPAFKGPSDDLSAGPEEVASLQGSEAILFVDDDPRIAEIAERGLRDHGYRVTSFTNSVEAFEEIQRHAEDFDLLISDMTMPGMTGEELARRAMAIRPGLPVILCTGHSDSMGPEKATEMGIKAYCEKPVRMEKLLHSVRRVLDSG